MPLLVRRKADITPLCAPSLCTYAQRLRIDAPSPYPCPAIPPSEQHVSAFSQLPLLPFHPYNSIMPLPFPIAPAPNGAFGIPTSFGVEFASASRLPER